MVCAEKAGKGIVVTNSPAGDGHQVHASVVGVVLTGGQSRRFGRDKARTPLLGRPMASWVVELLRSFVCRILIVTNDPERHRDLGEEVLADIEPGLGPIGGLYTALCAASTPWCLVVACDCPLLEPVVLERILNKTKSSTCDAVVPIDERGLQPLIAAYKSNCRSVIERQIRRGRLKIVDFFPELEVDLLPIEEVAASGGSQWSFHNINSFDDFALAENYLQSGTDERIIASWKTGSSQFFPPVLITGSLDSSEGEHVARGKKKSPKGIGNWASEGPLMAREPGPLAAALPIEQYLAAIVAHELSNPYTAMAGRVDLMRNRKDTSAALTRDLQSMRSAGDRIERILTNLKTFSRRESPPPRPVELLPIAQAAIEKFQSSPVAARAEVQLERWDGSVRAIADPGLLEAVLAATLEVLAERSPEVNLVEMGLAMNAADEEVSLVLKSEGPEFDEESVARIFHPFGGLALSPWGGTITLAYGYYIIRAWGGTYRFKTEGRTMITEICLALQA